MIPFPSALFGMIQLTSDLFLVALCSAALLVVLIIVRFWLGPYVVIDIFIGLATLVFLLAAGALVWIRHINRTIPVLVEYRASPRLDFEQDLATLLNQTSETKIEEVRYGFWGRLATPVRTEKTIRREPRLTNHFYRDMIFFDGTFAEQAKIYLSLTIGQMSATFTRSQSVSMKPSLEGKLATIDFLTVSSTTFEEVVNDAEATCQWLHDLGWPSACDEKSDWRSKFTSALVDASDKRFSVYLLKETDMGDYSAYAYLKNWDETSIRASIHVEIKNLRAPTYSSIRD